MFIHKRNYWKRSAVRIVVASVLLPGAVAASQARPELVLTPSLGPLTIGVPSTIGAVRHDVIAADSNGVLWALDSRRALLGAFDQVGRQRVIIGGPTTPGGPLRVPTAFVIVERMIYIFDARASRIVEYGLGDSVRFVRGIPIEADVSDMCGMNGYLYLFGLGEGHVLHRVRVADGSVASFGEPFGPPSSTIAQSMLSQGRLACVPEAHAVVLVPSAIPEVRVYDADGKLLSTGRLKRYAASVVTVNRDSSASITAPPAGFHLVTGVFRLSPDVVGVQLEMKGVPGGGNESVEMRLLSVKTGEELGTSRVPQSVVAVRAPFMYTARDRTRAVLDVHRFELRGLR